MKFVKRTLISICLAFLIIATVFVVYTAITRKPVCYFDRAWNDGKTLESYEQNVKLRSNAPNIFFHETSCNEDGVIRLTSRQACAIESAGEKTLFYDGKFCCFFSFAARMNPNREAFVLFTSQVGFRNQTPLAIIDALTSYSNINFNYLNLTHYAEQTPLEEWIKKGKLFRSEFLVSHTSDVLRYLSLWKYGGTYLDLDTVSLKPLDTVKPNFAAAMDGTYVAVGIINVEGTVGHFFATQFLKELKKSFNGNKWVRLRNNI